MTTVSVFHNISPDASFGLDRVFRTSETKPEHVENVLQLSDGRFMWKEFAATADERHELVFVFQYELPQDEIYTDLHALATAFETFNIGENELAEKYRARKLRSLSVGDVVVIGARAYSCDSVGWSRVELRALRILPAREAEKAVRARFQFKPNEELSLSVPLPD